MTSIRDQLADKIKADWPATPGVDVTSWAVEPDELNRPLVVVFREVVDQAPGGGTLIHRFTIQIYSQAGNLTRKAEDVLDGYLDNVLLSLRRLDVVAFEKATRKVFLEKFQGWEVEATWTSVDYYKTTVTNER